MFFREVFFVSEVIFKLFKTVCISIADGDPVHPGRHCGSPRVVCPVFGAGSLVGDACIVDQAFQNIEFQGDIGQDISCAFLQLVVGDQAHRVLIHAVLQIFEEGAILIVDGLRRQIVEHIFKHFGKRTFVFCFGV